MLILICGDRNWIDRAAIRRELLHFKPTSDTIMHGAARGADRIAGEEAQDLGFTVRSYPAKWDEYGKAAGPIRNQVMLDQNPELVLAFHPNIAQSKGTGDMVRRSRAKGVKVEVFSE